MKEALDTIQVIPLDQEFIFVDSNYLEVLRYSSKKVPTRGDFVYSNKKIYVILGKVLNLVVNTYIVKLAGYESSIDMSVAGMKEDNDKILNITEYKPTKSVTSYVPS